MTEGRELTVAEVDAWIADIDSRPPANGTNESTLGDLLLVRFYMTGEYIQSPIRVEQRRVPEFDVFPGSEYELAPLDPLVNS